ncbi:hypothetical protein BKA70DRAFT_1357190, partial [Coprinopsis sp. MPI-PUGE-AT-0042]
MATSPSPNSSLHTARYRSIWSTSMGSRPSCWPLRMATNPSPNSSLHTARYEIQINLVSILDESALMLAAENGRESVVKLLLQRTDIQVNLVNYRGYSA